MNNENLSRWLGVGANIGVLIGLLLLWTEISQTRQMTRAELGAGVMELQHDLYLGATSDTLSDAIAVAIFESDKLTNQQLVVLDGFMVSQIAQAQRAAYLVDMGIFEIERDSAVWRVMRKPLSYQFGLAWYAANKENFGPNFTSAIDRRLSNSSNGQDDRFLNQFKELASNSPD